MKFLFISEAGDSVGLALRLIEEGNEVAMWIRDDEASKRGEGMVPKIHDWEFEPDFDTVYIFDCTGSGFLASMLRSSGYHVFGGSTIADRLEMDRRFASEIMREHGIKTPKAKMFTDWDKAREAIEESDDDERLVFKPSGDLSGVVPSYVASDKEDLLQTLDHYRSKFHGEPEFEVQEFIKGVAVSTEGWFDGTRFLRPFNHTIERKELMNDDKGPSGGCTGNLVWAMDDCPYLLPLEDFLTEEGYKGPIDLNAILSEDGLYGLEFTPRFGYDATPTLLWWLLDGEIGPFFSDFARNQAGSEMQLRNGFAAGVRVSVAPWPTEKYHGPEGLPVRGLRGRDFGQFYPYDVMLKDDEYVTCGAYGIIGVAGGYDDSVEEAFAEAYRVADKVKLPGKQYRTDLAEVCKKDYNKCGRLIEA